MTDDEIAALQAENARLTALVGASSGGGGDGDGAPVVIVEEAPPAATIVAATEAQADAAVKVIHAETAQQVAIIEATSKAEQIADGAPTNEDGDIVHDDVSPESQHPYFRKWGGKR